ncbi:hypothetical protein [Inquilinus limosus]|uniref:Lipoprotein n=1 Tax=Inquilinus limosus TaxID=171674 RepID=A0A211YZ82_9PROT|nr:hypothetical protein [Inquilinus limosus]OWJ58309.1 hypothetical protein BWR60_33485 [Inquilinus limosus]
MRSILAIFVALLASACVPQQRAKPFVVVETFNERGAAGAQAIADRYCGKAGRTALAANRQWNYIGFQCVQPGGTLVAQTPIPPR